MIWVEKQLKYLLCLLKIFWKKYEYFTGEDLEHRPSMLEKTKFEYSPLDMPFSKAFEKDKAKSDDKSDSDFNYDSNYRLYKFFKGYDEFKEVSLDSKYNRIKEFNKLLSNFKALRPKNPKTQLKKKANYEKYQRALRKALRRLQK